MTTRPGYVWDATASEWVEIGQAAVVAPIAYQTSEPVSPATGDIWIDSDDEVPSVDSTLYYRWTKTMSGGETSLSGTDDNSLSLVYTVGYESVFINGVLQVRGSDYTATTGTTVTGLTALTASDVVTVESIVAYSIGDTYTQAQTDSLLDAKSPVSTTGLVLITQATIDTAVSSVTISSVFSATYEAYKVIITGGTGSANTSLRTQLRDGATTETGSFYKFGSTGSLYADGVYARDYSAGFTTNFTYTGYVNNTDAYLTYNVDLINPFLTVPTLISGQYAHLLSNRQMVGYLDTTTSYDSLVISPETGTLTGGSIRVYGYAK